MKTLEVEQYVVMKVYKLTAFEIWRDFNVQSYIACPRYPYIRVYCLYDTPYEQGLKLWTSSVQKASSFPIGLVVFQLGQQFESLGLVVTSILNLLYEVGLLPGYTM